MKSLRNFLSVSLISVLLPLGSAFGAINKSTQITGTFTDPSGTPFQGSIVLSLPFSGAVTQEGVAIAPANITYRIVNGSISPLAAQLVNNIDIASPQNTYYLAKVYDYSNSLLASFYVSIPDVATFNISSAQQTVFTSNNVSFAPTFVNAGTFATSVNQSYLQSLVGGINTSSEFLTTCIGCAPTTEGVTGAVTTPSGATNTGSFAGAFYAVSNADSRIGGAGPPGHLGNTVGVFSHVRCLVIGSACWTLNPVLTDAAGLLHHSMVGLELDWGENSAPDVAVGIQIFPNLSATGTWPASGAAIAVTNSGGFTAIPFGLVIGDNGSQTGWQLGANGTIANSASIGGSWCRRDSGNTRRCDMFAFGTSTGDINLEPATNRSVLLQTGGMFGSGVSGNTDFNGQLTFSGGTTSTTLTFSGTYISAPICTFAPLTDPVGRLYISTLSTTQLQLTDTSAFTGTVDYVCTKRN